MTSSNWKTSDHQNRLLIVNEKYFKATAIYFLYAQKRKGENYLYFNPNIDEETLAEIRDVVPDNTAKWGDQPENWISKTGKDHVFDCLKYCYLAKDFALANFRHSRYRFGRAPSIVRRFEKTIKKEDEKKQEEIKKSSWFEV